MKIDIHDLKQKTADAIAKGKKEAQAQKEQEITKAAAIKLEEEAQAQSVLIQVPTKCNLAAAKGENYAVVMRLTYGDYDYNTIKPLTGEGLKSAAKIVFDTLKQTNLQVSLEQWHDGVGINGGYEILVKW